MRKITINLAAVAAFCIVVASPALVSSSCATPKTEQEDTTIIREDSGITALKYSSPEVPASIEFCGKTIDLSRFDRHERMDRELLAFTYMHSTSLQMLKKANRYFPIVEPILKENGIPYDFKYLMVIESNMNPTARSSAGAAGLWQFMQGTGRDYGLEVNNNVDERYHIEKATRAACRYLKDAYAKYKDWVAVAASYNAGQARIASQLAKQDVDDSLDLQLVEETARYCVPHSCRQTIIQCPHYFRFPPACIGFVSAYSLYGNHCDERNCRLGTFRTQQRNQSVHIKEYESLVTGNILVQPQRADLRDKNPYQRRNDL